jgi:hypothetical protein
MMLSPLTIPAAATAACPSSAAAFAALRVIPCRATPFVAGSFAACFLSGACQFGSPAVDGNYKVMMSASAAGPCASSTKCGPQWGTGSLYGNMVNVRPF